MLNQLKFQYRLSAKSFFAISVSKVDNKLGSKLILTLQTQDKRLFYFCIPSIVRTARDQNDLIFFVLKEKSLPVLLLFEKLVTNTITSTKLERKRVRLKGLGYRISQAASELILKLGHSHPEGLLIPNSIKTLDIKKRKITIEGSDKIVIGNFVSKLCAKRPADAYKGKGLAQAYTQKKLKTVKKK